jgi:hypothetical protein
MTNTSTQVRIIDLVSHTLVWSFPDRSSGYGSNLTIDGTIECDAAIMDGLSGDFGSVGAVSGLAIFVTNLFYWLNSGR